MLWRMSPPTPEPTVPDTLTSVSWRLGQRGPTFSRFIVFAHLKGGSTKSTSAGTTAIRLAEHTGQDVLAVDADTRSQTLTLWKAMAGAAWPTNVRLETWPVEDLSGRIAAVLDGPSPPAHIVVDTGGHDVQIVQQAITAGARPRPVPGQPTVRGLNVVMPLAPTDPESLVVNHTYDIVKGLAWLCPISFRALITRVSPQRGYDDQDYLRAVAILDKLGVPFYDTYIPYLVKHGRAVGSIPRPVGDRLRDDDAGNYDAFLAELLAQKPFEVIA